MGLPALEPTNRSGGQSKSPQMRIESRLHALAIHTPQQVHCNQSIDDGLRLDPDICGSLGHDTPPCPVAEPSSAFDQKGFLVLEAPSTSSAFAWAFSDSAPCFSVTSAIASSRP